LVARVQQPLGPRAEPERRPDVGHGGRLDIALRPARALAQPGEKADTHRHAPEHTVAVVATGRRETESGIEVKPVYTAADATGGGDLPGEYPYTRGPYRDMYRGRPWTMRQYAGFASAEESNARYRY